MHQLLALLIVSIVNYTPFVIQDKRMCADAVDYYHQVYDDDDYLGDILNIMDYPVETLEGDGLVGDWGAKFGPIPSDEEVFREMLPPVGNVNGVGGSGGVGSADSFTKSCVINDIKSQLILYGESFKKSQPRSFEAPSPDSVLERRTSSSAGKTISFGTEISIPVRTRTKRTRSTQTNNSWSKSALPIPLQRDKKKRRNLSQHHVNETKRCSHCEITKTPQWREGPMGPKTLCNACGVRYRSGRLFPEYRPAASPSFVPALHSNSHRKVIEMRMKGGGVDDDIFRKKVLSSNFIDTS